MKSAFPMRIDITISLLLLVFFLSNCNKGNHNAPYSQPLITLLLDTGTYTASNMNDYRYELWEASTIGTEPVYLQWFSPQGPYSKGVVVITRPYVGIDWSGNPIDEHFAARPDDLCPPDDPKGRCYDIYSPGYDDGTPPQIWHRILSPIAFGESSADYYLDNDLAVLGIYGRYYAGGDIWNDVQDVVTGLRFLQIQPKVDKKNIAIIGNSWGGFLALYGAAYAPHHSKPKIALPIAPISDFEKYMDHIENLSSIPELAASSDALNDIIAPYKRRIFGATGGLPGGYGADYSLFDEKALLERLTSKVLIIHDEWDTIIPFEHSKSLVDNTDNNVEGLWFLHATSLNAIDYEWTHGPLGQRDDKNGFPAVATYSQSYILYNLNPDIYQTIYSASDLKCFFRNILALQQDGTDVNFLVPRLRELADSRVFMENIDDMSVMPGTDYVKSILESNNGDGWGQTIPGTIEEFFDSNENMLPAVPAAPDILTCDLPPSSPPSWGVASMAGMKADPASKVLNHLLVLLVPLCVLLKRKGRK